MTGLTRAVAIALALAVAAASLDATAQYPGGGTGGSRGTRGGMGGRGDAQDGGMGMSRPSLALADVVQTRLDNLQEDLRLTPAQRPAWAAYADKVKKLLADVQRTQEDAMRTEMSAPQRLDRLADVARNRATAIEDVADAGKALYALLTPEQRAVADGKMAIVVLPLIASSSAGADRRGDAPPRR